MYLNVCARDIHMRASRVKLVSYSSVQSLGLFGERLTEMWLTRCAVVNKISLRERLNKIQSRTVIAWSKQLFVLTGADTLVQAHERTHAHLDKQTRQ